MGILCDMGTHRENVSFQWLSLYNTIKPRAKMVSLVSNCPYEENICITSLMYFKYINQSPFWNYYPIVPVNMILLAFKYFNVLRHRTVGNVLLPSSKDKLVPLRYKPPAVCSCKLAFQNKSPNTLISFESVCSNQPLFSSPPFDPFISQSVHMVLRADTAAEPTPAHETLTAFGVFITLARALRGCRAIKIAGIRMPELAFSMSSNLFLIMTTFLASAVCRNDACERDLYRKLLIKLLKCTS